MGRGGKIARAVSTQGVFTEHHEWPCWSNREDRRARALLVHHEHAHSAPAHAAYSALAPSHSTLAPAARSANAPSHSALVAHAWRGIPPPSRRSPERAVLEPTVPGAPDRVSRGSLAVHGRRPSNDLLRQHREFLARVGESSRFELLFDYLPDVYFFVKDRSGRFMRCNRAFANLVRARAEEEVLGLRDSDFFPSGLADNYVRDDHTVMATRTPIIQKLELVCSAQGSMNWHSTTKLPVLDARGEVIGIAGVTRDFSRMKSTGEHLSYWAPVLETIINHYAEPLSMASLAAKLSLSVSQFERRFKKRFQTTPRKYLTNVRINAACQLLSTTDLPIAAIALQTGFYDQSHLNKQFIKNKGTTPAQFRRSHVQLAGLEPV
jgi:PAS domain S-box-containing protein